MSDLSKRLRKLKEKNPDMVLGTADEVLKDVKIIRTPFSSFNGLVKGFPRGHFSTIAGPEKTGKGTLLVQTIAYNQSQNPDFTAVYTDAENGLDPTWCRHLGIDLDRMVIQKYGRSKEQTMEKLLEAGLEICCALEADMWVIDSVAALIPRAEQEKTLEQDTMLDLQRKLPVFFRKANVQLPSKTATVLVGQVYAVPNTRGIKIEEVKGGNALKHWAELRIKTRRTGKADVISKEKKIVGQDGIVRAIPTGWTCQITLEKTRMNNKEGQKINLPFELGRGFSSVLSAVTSALGTDVIIRSGPMYKWKKPDGKEVTWKGKDSVFRHFQDSSNELELLNQHLESLAIDLIEKKEKKNE